MPTLTSRKDDAEEISSKYFAPRSKRFLPALRQSEVLDNEKSFKTGFVN
jgi:hypothetical protein